MRKSERLVFTPLSHAEVDGGYWRWFNDAHVTQGMVHGALPMTKEECSEYVARLGESNNDIVFAVYTQEPITHIGNTSLQRICWHHKHAEFGIIIGGPEHRSKGYGTEMVKYMVDYAFNELNLHRVYLGVLATNVAAIRAYEKAGFRVTGRDREAVYKYGRYVDVIRMDILKEGN